MQTNIYPGYQKQPEDRPELQFLYILEWQRIQNWYPLHPESVQYADHVYTYDNRIKLTLRFYQNLT